MQQAADETQEHETETADEVEQQLGDQAEQSTGAQGEQQAEQQAGAGEGVTVSIGEESPTSEEDEIARAPEWVRDLRKANREKDRQLREQREEIERLKGGSKPLEVGAKPTLEGCDYDTERFEREFDAWRDRKAAAEAEARKREQAQEASQREWQASLQTHAKHKAEVPFADYDDAEAAMTEVLDVNQQGVIVSGAKNSAMVIYALYRHPKKAKELASIKDPIKFAFAVADLESQLKVTKKKSPPPPESTVRGSAPGMGAMDSHLQRLEAEAEKTGDRSKVVAYKKQQKQRAAA